MNDKDQELLDQLRADGVGDTEMKLAEILMENSDRPAPGDINEISGLVALIMHVTTSEMFPILYAISTDIASEMLIAPAISLYNIGRARGKADGDTITLGDSVE